MLAAIISIPAAIAVIWTVKLFLAHIERKDALVSTEREEDRREREANRIMFENHLSSTVRVLQAMSEKLDRLLSGKP